MQFEWACVKLDPPINSGNWISCVTLYRSCVAVDSKAKFGSKQKCKEFLAFSSQSRPEVRLLIDSSSCSNKKSFKSQSSKNGSNHPGSVTFVKSSCLLNFGCLHCVPVNRVCWACTFLIDMTSRFNHKSTASTLHIILQHNKPSFEDWRCV